MKKILVLSVLAVVIGFGVALLTEETSEALDPDCTPTYITPVLIGNGATCAQATNDLRNKVDTFVEMDCFDGECGSHWLQVTTPCYIVGGQYRVHGKTNYKCDISWGGGPGGNNPDFPCSWYEDPPYNCQR